MAQVTQRVTLTDSDIMRSLIKAGLGQPGMTWKELSTRPLDVFSGLTLQAVMPNKETFDTVHEAFDLGFYTTMAADILDALGTRVKGRDGEEEAWELSRKTLSRIEAAGIAAVAAAVASSSAPRQPSVSREELAKLLDKMRLIKDGSGSADDKTESILNLDFKARPLVNLVPLSQVRAWVKADRKQELDIETSLFGTLASDDAGPTDSVRPDAQKLFTFIYRIKSGPGTLEDKAAKILELKFRGNTLRKLLDHRDVLAWLDAKPFRSTEYAHLREELEKSDSIARGVSEAEALPFVARYPIASSSKTAEARHDVAEAGASSRASSPESGLTVDRRGLVASPTPPVLSRTGVRRAYHAIKNFVQRLLSTRSLSSRGRE